MSRRLVRELEKEYEVEDRSSLALAALDCLEVQEQCKLVADIVREIPHKFWGTDEGTNKFIVIGQCPRTQGRVTNFTTLFPNLSLLLAHLVQLVQPEPIPYTTLSLRTGPGKPPHRDARNSHAPTTIIGLSDYTKGRLWIEHPRGTTAGWAPGSQDSLQGFFHDIRHKAVIFSGKTLLHGTERWSDGERIIVNAWCPQLAVNNTDYFNTILHLRGLQPPCRGKDLDDFALATYYGHHVVKQLRLRESLQPRNPPELVAPSSSSASESEDVKEVPDRHRSRSPSRVD